MAKIKSYLVLLYFSFLFPNPTFFKCKCFRFAASTFLDFSKSGSTRILNFFQFPSNRRNVECRGSMSKVVKESGSRLGFLHININTVISWSSRSSSGNHRPSSPIDGSIRLHSFFYKKLAIRNIGLR